jgi:hypothetical protein
VNLWFLFVCLRFCFPMSAAIEVDSSKGVYDKENAHEEDTVQYISHNKCDHCKPNTNDQNKAMSQKTESVHRQIFFAYGFQICRFEDNVDCTDTDEDERKEAGERTIVLHYTRPYGKDGKYPHILCDTCDYF